MLKVTSEKPCESTDSKAILHCSDSGEDQWVLAERRWNLDPEAEVRQSSGPPKICICMCTASFSTTFRGRTKSDRRGSFHHGEVQHGLIFIRAVANEQIGGTDDQICIRRAVKNQMVSVSPIWQLGHVGKGLDVFPEPP